MIENNQTVRFYNDESSVYSDKRYNGSTNTYVQFFFQQRRKIVLNLLKDILKDKKDLSLIDIGCADGVLTGDIDDLFPGKFRKMVGTDISPGMIEVAKKKYQNKKHLSFYVKDECPVEKFDIALGLGYVSAEIYESEVEYLSKRLISGGYYLLTFTSNSSIYSRFKLRDKPYFKNYRTYGEYENMLRKYFVILNKKPNGFFVPKLWQFPVIGRLLQPVFNFVFSFITPNLFHETIYVVKLK